MRDIGNGLCDVGRGALDAVVDLVKGIGGLLKGVGEIILWAGASVLEPFGVELLDEIEDDVEQIFATGKMVLSDPVNAIGAIGQNICDVVDEEGIAYSVSYVAADVLIEIALEKGLGKVKEFKNAKYVNKVDEAADAAGDLTGVERNVINKIDEVIESGSKTTDYYVGLNGKALPSQYKDWIGTNIRDELLSQAENPQLKNAIKQLYRGNRHGKLYPK